MSHPNPSSTEQTHRPGRCLMMLLAGLMVSLSLGCEHEPARDRSDAAPVPDAQPDPEPEASAEPEPEAPAEPEPEAPPEPEPEPEPDAPRCPDDAREGDACVADGLECGYPKNECPCGDPYIYFVCERGAFAVLGEDHGCGHAPDACNSAACDAGPGGACPADGGSCWFDDGAEDLIGQPIYRRWHCIDGLLEATDELHANGI